MFQFTLKHFKKNQHFNDTAVVMKSAIIVNRIVKNYNCIGMTYL